MESGVFARGLPQRVRSVYRRGNPFPLYIRENDLTFLCLKEKLQKKQTNVPFDRLCVWERYTESPKTCAASSPTHDSACSRRVLGLRFFGSLHCVEALPDGGRASSGLHRPQALISSPPIADEKSYICSLTGRYSIDIKRLALRESSRRSRVRGLSADRAVAPSARRTRLSTRRGVRKFASRSSERVRPLLPTTP